MFVADDGVCKLGDFGLALVAETQASCSSSGRSAGATRWLAPEALDPEQFPKGKDPAARDVYAFACTVLEVSGTPNLSK